MFVHYSAIQSDGYRSLEENQVVEFDIVQGPKGKRKVAVEDVPVGPGKNSLKKGELIEAIDSSTAPSWMLTGS